MTDSDIKTLRYLAVQLKIEGDTALHWNILNAHKCSLLCDDSLGHDGIQKLYENVGRVEAYYDAHQRVVNLISVVEAELKKET